MEASTSYSISVEESLLAHGEKEDEFGQKIRVRAGEYCDKSGIRIVVFLLEKENAAYNCYGIKF